MKKISIIIISALTSLTVLGTVHAKSFNSEKRLEQMTEKLSLTEAQQENFKNFLNEKTVLMEQRKSRKESKNKEKGEESSEEQSNTRGAMSELLAQEQISTDEIYAIMDEKIANSRDKRQNMLNSFVVFYNSLDAEQRNEVAPLLRKVLKGSTQSRAKKGKHHSKRS